MEPKLSPKMKLFSSHFQRVKSCESVVNNVQIAFLRIPKKSIDFGAILTPILDPYRDQKCSLYSKRSVLAQKSSIRKRSWTNQICKFWQEGGEVSDPWDGGGRTHFEGHF